MTTFELSQETKDNISACVGIPFEEIYNWDYEAKPSKDIVFSKHRDLRKIGRGNPLLARRRFRTIEEVEKRLKEISGFNNE